MELLFRTNLSYCHPRNTHHRVKKPSTIIVLVLLLGSNKHKNLGVTPSSKLPCFNFINLTPSPSPSAFPSLHKEGQCHKLSPCNQ
jgi:hypothetical protein